MKFINLFIVALTVAYANAYAISSNGDMKYKRHNVDKTTGFGFGEGKDKKTGFGFGESKDKKTGFGFGKGKDMKNGFDLGKGKDKKNGFGSGMPGFSNPKDKSGKKYDRFIIPNCKKGKEVKFGKFKGYYGSTFKYSASTTKKFKLYRVKKESVSIREKTYASSTSIGSLVSGQYIIGSSESQNWVQFGEGYVDTSSLVEVQGTSGYYVTSDIITRTGPSVSYSEIASVVKGTEITYYGVDPNDSNWCITDAGYIEKKYLSIKSETASYVSTNTSTSTSAYSSSLAYISSSAFKTKEILCKKQNYGQKRNINSIKYIVIHSASSYEQSSSSYGYSAQYYANYYQKSSKKQSFHYIIDGSHVISSVPDNYVAWPIGTSHWKSSSISNSNTLNIALCNEQSSEASVSSTMNMTVKVVKEIMKKYHISWKNVILASDVSKTATKKSWMKKSIWKSFKSRIQY